MFSFHALFTATFSLASLFQISAAAFETAAGSSTEKFQIPTPAF